MLELAQNTTEWLAFRRERIGASDAPVIMGESSWCTPYRRWQEKLGLVEAPASTYVMRRGIEREPLARARFAEHTGIKVEPRVLVHPEIDWMIASMDGVSDCGTVGVEIKHARAADHAEALQGRVPKKYYAQLQHQHEVGHFRALYYCSIGSDDSMCVFEVPRDDVYIAAMMEKEKEFYDCITNFESPDFLDSDFDNCVDIEVERTAAELREVIFQLRPMKALEAREKELREKLIKSAGGRATKVGGFTIAPYSRRGAVQYKSIPELQGVDLDAYRKPASICWRITQE